MLSQGNLKSKRRFKSRGLSQKKLSTHISVNNLRALKNQVIAEKKMQDSKFKRRSKKSKVLSRLRVKDNMIRRRRLGGNVDFIKS